MASAPMATATKDDRPLTCILGLFWPPLAQKRPYHPRLRQGLIAAGRKLGLDELVVRQIEVVVSHRAARD